MTTIAKTVWYKGVSSGHVTCVNIVTGVRRAWNYMSEDLTAWPIFQDKTCQRLNVKNWQLKIDLDFYFLVFSYNAIQCQYKLLVVSGKCVYWMGTVCFIGEPGGPRKSQFILCLFILYKWYKIKLTLRPPCFVVEICLVDVFFDWLIDLL